MTLLITAVAAVITTIIWYLNEKARKLKIGTLALAYLGASLMWLVDAIVEYIEIGVDYFSPSASDMLNDSFLGLSVAVLGLVVWTVLILIKDLQNVIRNIAVKKNKI